MDEDFEVVPPSDWPETVRGAEAAWEYYRKIMDAFGQFPLDDPEVVAVGADKVVAHYRLDLSGRASGAGVEFDYCAVFTVRQGKVLRAHWFADRAEALEAAGLQE